MSRERVHRPAFQPLAKKTGAENDLGAGHDQELALRISRMLIRRELERLERSDSRQGKQPPGEGADSTRGTSDVVGFAGDQRAGTEPSQPVLDRSVGATPRAAPAGPRRQPDADPGSGRVYDRVVVTNIVAAQYTLDALLQELVDHKHPDASAVATKLARAGLYLQEAVDALVLASMSSTEVKRAIASFSVAHRKVNQAIAGLGDPALEQATKSARDGLMRRATTIMFRYGELPTADSDSSYRSTLRRRAQAGGFEVDALRASLRLAELEARRGFQQLIGPGGDLASRLATVQRAATTIHRHLGHASMMLLGELDDHQRAALRPAVEVATAQVLLIKRWIDGRPGNADMTTAFANAVAVANGARAGVGLGAVELEAARGFPEREEKEEKGETKAMTQATGDFADAWQNLELAMQEGVDRWFALASRTDQEHPSFLSSLASALITAALGNFGGLVAKALFEVAQGDKVKAAAQELVSNVVSDSAQAILGPALNAAIAESGSGSNLKALLYVRGGLKQICRGLKTAAVKKLNEQVAADMLSIAEVQGLEAAARRSEKTATDRLAHQSAVDWVRYVAQSSLRGSVDRGDAHVAHPNGTSVSNPVTNLSGYYGRYLSDYDRRPGNREGTAGVLRVHARTHTHDISPSYEPAIMRVEVNGMDSAMAEMLLDDPDIKTLDELKVPKEVHIEIGPHRRDARPRVKLAVDELGHIKDFDAPPSKYHEFAPIPGNDLNAWWNIFRRLPLSKSLINS